MSNTHSNDRSPAPDAAGASDAATDREVLGADAPHPDTDAEKPVDEWVTGDEPMTGPQRSYLDTLARESGETLPADLTKAEASAHIERLQDATGRG